MRNQMQVHFVVDHLADNEPAIELSHISSEMPTGILNDSGTFDL